MIFFTKPIKVTSHCYERFSERVGDSNGKKIYKTRKEIRQKILSDFTIKNIRYKEPKDEKGIFQLFVNGARIYVLQETNKTIVVKTVIQQTVSQAKEFKKTMRKS